MAPLLQPRSVPDWDNFLDERQNAGAAPQITMTVTRGTTVYTTVIQLGSNQNTSPPQPAPTTAPNSPAATTEAENPEPSYSLVTPVGEDSNRGAVAGAVIGSILGFLVLLWLLWRCRVQAQNRVYDSDTYSYDSRDYRSRSSDSFYSSEMRQRGGGGSEWKRQHNRVRKPTRTRRSGRSHRRATNDDLGFDVSECRSERGVGYRGWTRRRSGDGNWNWSCFDVIFGIPRRRRGPSIHAWGGSRYGGSNASGSRRSGKSVRGNMSTIDD